MVEAVGKKIKKSSKKIKTKKIAPQNIEEERKSP